MPGQEFHFKQFSIRQDRCALKVGTDAVLFGAWVRVDGARRILDMGTGTGVLALIAAQRNALAFIDAVEIDDAAAGQAAENVAASPWADRVRVHRMDVRRLHAARPYDLIICNPPYYAGYSTSSDPRSALARHSSELRFPDLFDAVQALLASGGRFAAVIPIAREKEFITEAARIGLGPVRRCAVRYVAHRPAKRVMLELGGKGHLQDEELTVEASGPADPTSRFRALVAELRVNY